MLKIMVIIETITVVNQAHFLESYMLQAKQNHAPPNAIDTNAII